MNKLMSGLQKNDPADQVVMAKVYSFVSLLSLLYGHKVNLLKVGLRAQRIPRKKR